LQLLPPCATRNQTVFVGQQSTRCIAGVRHGAELVDGEGPPVQAGASLAEENWQAQLEAHQERQQREGRSK